MNCEPHITSFLDLLDQKNSKRPFEKCFIFFSKSVSFYIRKQKCRILDEQCTFSLLSLIRGILQGEFPKMSITAGLLDWIFKENYAIFL